METTIGEFYQIPLWVYVLTIAAAICIIGALAIEINSLRHSMTYNKVMGLKDANKALERKVRELQKQANVSNWYKASYHRERNERINLEHENGMLYQRLEAKEKEVKTA